MIAAGVTVGNAADNEEYKVTPSSLWTAADGITVEENVDLPEYFYNGKALTTGETVHDRNSSYWSPTDINGILVSSTTTVRSLDFNNVIDVSEYTKNDRLLDFTPITSSRHVSADFGTLYVTLQDYDDPDNWVKVEFYAGTTQFSVKSYVKVHTSTGYVGGYKWGQLSQSGGVSGLETSVAGFYNSVAVANPLNWEDYCAMQFSLRYDAAENAIRLGGAYTHTDPQYVLKLDDSGTVGNGNEWTGFKNGRVKLSITVDDINADVARFYITRVANIPMCGESVTDDGKPSVLVKIPEGDVSTTAAGYKYKLFDCEFNDAVDGRLDYEVYLKTPEDEDFSEFSIGKDYFVPLVAGKNVLRYYAKDKSGNEAYRDFELNVVSKDELVAPYIDAEEIADVAVGQTVKISTPEYGGGVGSPVIENYVVRLSDGKIIANDATSVTPYTEGEYAVVFKTEDYIGWKEVKTVYFDAVNDGNPVFDADIEFYDKFVSGVTVELPKPLVYDFSSVQGQKLAAEVNVKAVGSGNKSDYEEKIENYVFTPDKAKFGDEVTVVYETYCRDYGENKVVKSFTVPIFKPEYMWEYFSVGKDVVVNYNKSGTTDSYVSFASRAGSKDTSAKYLYPLYVRDLAIQFASPASRANFDGLVLEFTDFTNSENKAKFVVKQYNAELCSVEFNGKIGYAEGVLGNSTSVIWLSISDGKLYDMSTGNYMFDVDGENGFDCEKAWLKIDYLNLNGDSVTYIKKINNHIFKASYSNGKLRKFNDAISPKIVLDEPVIWESDIGETVKVPDGRGYDEFSSYTEVYVTVKAPTGNLILDNVKSGGGLSFETNEYGVYYVTYTCKDAAGNIGKTESSVYVRDVEIPILFCGEESTTCKVGQKLTFRGARAIDNVDGVLTVTAFIITPASKFVNITESNAYTFETAGKYVLRYCATDSNNNLVYKDYVIIVTKEGK